MENRNRAGWVGSVGIILLLILSFTFFHVVEASPPTLATATPPVPPQNFEVPPVYLPLLQAMASLATPIPTPLTESYPTPAPLKWDARLDQRGTQLRTVQAVPGQGYWRLVRAVWYDEQESEGRHHILVDVLDAGGQRITGVPIRFYWGGGETILLTQTKPGEAYAVDFGMFDVAPSYGAFPADGHPADEVWGMGLGSIEQPKYKIHSSYGLVWQWTVVAEPATPAPSTTPVPTLVSTDEPTSETPTATQMPTATPITTLTPVRPSRQWDPRLDQRGTELRPVDISPGQGYWRLVQGNWHDQGESQGRHHIFVDVRDEHGNRITGMPMRVYWNGGETIVYTEQKPGEPAAASFGMNAIAPAYGVIPADGYPADEVWGMGLGSIEQPYYTIQTSYTFIWQWTIPSND